MRILIEYGELYVLVEHLDIIQNKRFYFIPTQSNYLIV